MQIKISDYNLTAYYHTPVIEPGMKVCPCNGATSVGIVIDVSTKKASINSYEKKKYPETVTVLWGTGTKRGKKMLHKPDSLVDLDGYMQAIKRSYDKLDEMVKEAQTIGM